MATQMFDYGPGRTAGLHPSETSWSTYSETINQRMRVPERIRVAPVPLAEEEQRSEEIHPAYTMQIPDKLALTDVPDLSARPVVSKHGSGLTSSMWDLHQGAFGVDAAYLQHSAQSPIRRSYSDQAFGRSPPLTPTRTKEALHSPSFSRSSGRALAPSQRGSATADPPAATSTPKALALGSLPPNLLSAQGVLQAAKELGQQASQRLLQTVAQKYSSRFGIPENPSSRSSTEVQPYTDSRRSALQESWLSPEEDSGTVVEFIVLRRQLLKMSRRLAALERQNVEHKQAEMLLFSLMVSAVLLNGWLWMRR